MVTFVLFSTLLSLMPATCRFLSLKLCGSLVADCRDIHIETFCLSWRLVQARLLLGSRRQWVWLLPTRWIMDSRANAGSTRFSQTVSLRVARHGKRRC